MVGRGQSINQSTAFHSVPTVTIPPIFGQLARSLVGGIPGRKWLVIYLFLPVFLYTLNIINDALHPQMQLYAFN